MIHMDEFIQWCQARSKPTDGPFHAIAFPNDNPSSIVEFCDFIGTLYQDPILYKWLDTGRKKGKGPDLTTQNSLRMSFYGWTIRNE